MVAFIFGIRVIKFEKAKYAAVAASDCLKNTLQFHYKIYALELIGMWILRQQEWVWNVAINMATYGFYLRLCKQEN